MIPDWLELNPGRSRLILSIPHAGTEIPEPCQPALRSLWLARRDADWWLPQLYAFAEDLGATILRTHISRSVIDVNRDPSGASLYPGQATTGLCPLETFDGEALYPAGRAPDAAEIAARRARYFLPYHAALAGEIARLKNLHGRVVLVDAHSIRSRIPLLFEGILPVFNIGTNDGKSCDPALGQRVAELCAASGRPWIMNGRFKGGYITRQYGNPAHGVHAIQMELACRGYMTEPDTPAPDNWPAEYAPEIAAPMQDILKQILESLMP